MKAKQLITIETENSKTKLDLNERVLKGVLEKAGTSKVAVISVTGNKRSGKSYLLNFILRLFSWEQDEDEDWMGWDNPNAPLEGFEWGGGDDAVTFGVWIWPEPLMAKTSKGEVVALLLLDTQGTMNEYTTENESLAIAGLCFVLSSVTLYNVKNGIEEDNFHLIRKALQLCTEIGIKKYRDLIFAVRDWKDGSGFEYGLDGGAKYLQKHLEIKKKFIEDSKLSRELIKKCFASEDCILLPDPGNKVREISHKGFLSDINPLFTDNLEEIRSIFNPDNLYKKAVGKNTIDIVTLFKNWVSAFNERQGKSTGMGNQVTQQSNTTYLQAFEKYKQSFENSGGQVFSTRDLTSMHQETLEKALHYLEEENGDTPNKIMKEIRSKFDELVQEFYADIVKSALKKEEELKQKLEDAAEIAKESYTEEIKKVLSRSNTTEKLAELKKNLAKEESLTIFLEALPKKFQKSDFTSYKIGFEKELDSIFAKMMQNWKTKKEGALMLQWEMNRPTLNEEYKKRMETFCGDKQFVDVDTLRENHGRVIKFVVDSHFAETEYGAFEDKLRDQIIGDMESSFEELERVHRTKMAQAIENKVDRVLAEAKNDYKDTLDKASKDTEISLEAFKMKIEDSAKKVENRLKAKLSDEPDEVKRNCLRKLKEEFDNYDTVVLQNFSVKKNNSITLESRKTEALKKITALLESYTKSIDVTTAEKVSEHKNILIQKGTIIINSINSTDGGIPSSTLESLKSEAFQLIEDKLEDISRSTLFAVAEAKSKAEGIVGQCLELYKKKMEIVPTLTSEQELEKLHEDSLRYCLEVLKTQSDFTNDDLLKPYNEKLKNDIKFLFDTDIKKVFEFSAKTNKLQLETAELEVVTLYREDMDEYFKRKPYTLPKDLLVQHAKVALANCNKIALRLQLQESQKTQLMGILDKYYGPYEDKNKMNTPTDDPAIGIDLGTTYTCVAIYDKGEAKVIVNEEGKSTFPSYVSFTDTGEYVGHNAKDMAHIHPENTIFDAKRLIGRRFDEKSVQRDIKHWPFQVISENNVPKFKVQTKDGPKVMPPEQISAKILDEVRRMAERQLGKKIKKAVITVPAYFNDGQRQATIDAGEIAGLEVLQIINEPTAAALAYHLNTKGVQKDINVLVYDLGGGTFDVVILTMKPGGTIVVRSVNGDTHLGGEDFDDNLLKEAIKIHKTKTGTDLAAGKDSKKEDEKTNTARILRRLRNACEMAKINISGGDNTNGFINVVALDGNENFNEPITREQFEEINMELFLKTLDVVRKALVDAKLKKEDIDDIVLVGGSTRIPKVQQMLSEFFNGKTLSATVNPDEAVACGAAIQAAILNGNQEQILKQVSLQDVTPLSLGVEVSDGSVSVIIPRNTPLPVTKMQKYYTAFDNQTVVSFPIYEGEERIAKDNHLLGEFEIRDVPKKKAGQEKFDVTMTVNKEGILKVSAVCVSTKKSNNITIEEHRGRLTKAEKRALKEVFDTD